VEDPSEEEPSCFSHLTLLCLLLLTSISSLMISNVALLKARALITYLITNFVE
jgi:hypothetical protein